MIHFETITTVQVRYIHARIMSSGLQGEREGLIEGAIGRIETRIAYNLFEDIFDVAGCYAAFIASSYAFADGNKRTALRVSSAFLGAHGMAVKFNTPPNELFFDLIIACADGNSDEIALASYLREKFG